jgi:hypothetical protein
MPEGLLLGLLRCLLKLLCITYHKTRLLSKLVKVFLVFKHIPDTLLQLSSQIFNCMLSLSNFIDI